jgi:uncharacterized protein (DUF885 family)
VGNALLVGVKGPVCALLMVTSAVGLMVEISGCQQQREDANARFQALYTAEWKWRQHEFVHDGDSEAVANRLPEADAATQDARLKFWEEVLRKLDAIPRAELSPEQQVNYDVYRPQIQVLIANQRFRDYQMPVNSNTAFWTDLGYTARRRFRTLQDYKNWLSQLHDVPRYFHEQMNEMRAGMKRGFTPPRITLEGRDASLAAVTDATPEASLLYTPFKDMPGISEAAQSDLRSQAIATIRDVVQPAYVDLAKFIRAEYIPGCRTTLAAKDLPDGSNYYRAKIREFTTLDLDPADIHSLGEAEVSRLHAQMLVVMKETGFKGDFPAFLQYLRNDPQFYAKSADELLMRAAWIAKKFDGKAALFFGYLPRARFAIRPVSDDLAPFYPGAMGGPGLYLLNTYDLPSRPLYNLTEITLHESAPGHAFQIPIAAEHLDQPGFRQRTWIDAYGEGWALYCEWLGLEMGMYETPYERFGMLGGQVWRAARLVVDTGLHSQGWSREKAIAYLHDYTALSGHEIETEVDRYIALPAQALSYYLGEREILAARQKAQRALGSRFNIRAFHDAVLELGSVPMPLLAARIDRFIADGGQGPYPEME